MTARQIIDPTALRAAFGRYPTSVCIVTGRPPGEAPAGMVVGTFTSVSLDPPLAGFLPARTSRTWPRLMQSETLCATILSADQSDVCGAFFNKTPAAQALLDAADTTPGGAPIIAGGCAWYELEVERQFEMGDHAFVLARVNAFAALENVAPLVFHAGGLRALR